MDDYDFDEVSLSELLKLAKLQGFGYASWEELHPDARSDILDKWFEELKERAKTFQVPEGYVLDNMEDYEHPGWGLPPYRRCLRWRPDHPGAIENPEQGLLTFWLRTFTVLLTVTDDSSRKATNSCRSWPRIRMEWCPRYRRDGTTGPGTHNFKATKRLGTFDYGSIEQRLSRILTGYGDGWRQKASENQQTNVAHAHRDRMCREMLIHAGLRPEPTDRPTVLNVETAFSLAPGDEGKTRTVKVDMFDVEFGEREFQQFYRMLHSMGKLIHPRHSEE